MRFAPLTLWVLRRRGCSSALPLLLEQEMQSLRALLLCMDHNDSQPQLPMIDQLKRKPMTLRFQSNKKPRTWRGLIGVRLFCREIDNNYSTPAIFPLRSFGELHTNTDNNLNALTFYHSALYKALYMLYVT